MVRAAQAVVLALVLLALARAVRLELDPYDAYEVRTSARALAGDPQAPFLVYRSPLLQLAQAPFERWAHGSRAAWVFPHVLGALAYGALALAAVALARAAGASRQASWAAGVAVALDRLAFADAPLGLPDALAAALAAGGLARGILLLEPDAKPRRVLETAALLGLAAATRPNAGLAALALVVGILLVDRSRVTRAVVAAGLALALYLLVTTLVFALGKGSLAGGIAAHSELATFQREQLAENARRYGALHPPAGVYLRAALFMEPGTILLLPVGLWFLATKTREFSRAAILLLGALSHFAFLCLLVGHAEARYFLPGLVPLSALAALALDALGARVPSRGGRVALALAWLAVPLALGARFESARATDPALGRSFSARVAREVENVAPVGSSSGRVLWAPDLPFPVYPAVLAREGTPFPGDPFHGIFHAGPLTVGYHLERPILLLRRAEGSRSSDPRSELDALARNGTLRAGDVVLESVAEPGLSWTLSPSSPPPELSVLEVVAGVGPDAKLVERARVGP